MKNHFSHQFKNVPAFLLRDARHLASDIKLEPRIIKNKNIILCTSNDEITNYVKIGLLRYLALEDKANRELIEKNIEGLKEILKEVNRYNTYEEAM